ncbi:MAG TPA: hypothetical protein VMI06_00445 [Terriglobia bacterium]|nr:hypothetical protein [Terriglobia bacterium]
MRHWSLRWRSRRGHYEIIIFAVSSSKEVTSNAGTHEKNHCSSYEEFFWKIQMVVGTGCVLAVRVFCVAAI